MLVVGLISGTSADGVTAALVNIEAEKTLHASPPELQIKLLESATYPFPPGLREELLCLSESGDVSKLCSMNYFLGEIFAQAALDIIAKTGYDKSAIDLIGSAGQTVCHLPKRGGTLQIGEPDVIAERTGITTIGDFRPRDIAAGGEGAPLIPYADYLLFASPMINRVLLNIGGIANLTYIPASAFLNEVLAFDTGPGNMLIDEFITHLSDGERCYDKDGRFAARGLINDELLAELLEHPFICRLPPKSTGREEFGRVFGEQIRRKGKRIGISDEDLAATLTAFTAAAVAENCELFLGKVDEVIVSGGGARNRTLIKMLTESFRASGARLTTTDEYDIPVDAKEALGFAILAYQTFHQRPGNVPQATGAKRPVILGKISFAGGRYVVKETVSKIIKPPLE